MSIRQRSILVVDDDALNRKLEEALLRADGFDVRSVESGQQALAAIALAPPDLILLDLMMPGMDGFELVRRLKSDPVTSAIPIVMVTALDDSGSRARLASAGVSELITKPIDRWQFQACIQRLLGAPHGDT